MTQRDNASERKHGSEYNDVVNSIIFLSSECRNIEQQEEENVGVEDRLPHQKRSLQQVVSISCRRETVRWMMNEFYSHGKKELISKAVSKFPE